MLRGGQTSGHEGLTAGTRQLTVFGMKWGWVLVSVNEQDGGL